ncbi:MAG: hypothetical protein LAC66_04575 [Methylotenera sp.]|nr:hypothetical protein [Methylotenera sp.]
MTRMNKPADATHTPVNASGSLGIKINEYAQWRETLISTINALFFADFNQRLLPSAPGRTTMCPTEIFANDEPAYIKLLPIETKFTDASLTELKSKPELWQKFLLDTNSAEAMKETLSALVEKRSVDLATAKSLDKRAAALMESHNHAELTEKNICVGEGEALQLTEQLQQLDDLLLKLMRSAKYHIETSSSGV